MDPKLRKSVLRSISNGMYVITTGRGDQAAGATITWMTQCSFEPPLLVAGVRAGSAIHDGLRATMRAVVHVLDESQEDVAKRFFSPADVEADTLNGLTVVETSSGPRLVDAGAWAECAVREMIDCGGDHELVVLEVVDVGAAHEIEPLTVRQSPWQYGG